MSELQKKSSVGSISWDNILNKLHTRIEGRTEINCGQGETTNNINYTKHHQNLQATNSHRTNNDYLYENTNDYTQTDSVNENYDSDIETTSDFKSDFTEFNRNYKPKFQQPSQNYRKRTDYNKEDITEEPGNSLIPAGHIVDRINFDRVLKTLPKEEGFRVAPVRQSVFHGQTNNLFSKLDNLAKGETEKSL